MRSSLYLLLLLTLLGSTGFSKSAEEGEIAGAAKSYVAAHSGLTKVTVTVEQVEDDFARVKVTPEDAKAADPAWVFLKRTEGKWTGLVLGTSFTTEDYQQLGIPNALRIP